jgi:MFS family permease
MFTLDIRRQTMNPIQSPGLHDDAIEDPSASKRVQRRAAIASVIGTTIEWYDFFIYGTAAALVFPTLFFSHGGSDGLMESFATIFVGFLARPLGGALFGHMGDRVGRKSTLVATLTLMGVATVLVGFLPTAQAIGPAAGWLLIGLRFLQGIGVGGEWGGAVLLSMESHNGKRRGFMASLPNVGVPLGLVISVLVWSACSHLSGSALLEHGWRIPFLASGVLLIFGLLIRVGVPETRDFIEANKSVDRKKSPLGEAIRTEWRAILLSALIRPGEQAAFYMLTTFAVLYGSKAPGARSGLHAHCRADRRPRRLLRLAVLRLCRRSHRPPAHLHVSRHLHDAVRVSLLRVAQHATAGRGNRRHRPRDGHPRSAVRLAGRLHR